MAKRPYTKKPLAQRLTDRSIPEPNSGCWLFEGVTLPGGYGQIGVNGRMRTAHRASYECFVGPIPEGACVLHRCDVRSCINPEHLRLGTKRENTADMIAKGRAASLERHGSARLTIEAIREIRSSTLMSKTLAATFNVSPATVSDVCRNRYWRGVV